jgi:hypothetical protein
MNSLTVQEIRPRGLRLTPMPLGIDSCSPLIQEADKLTLRQYITLRVPCQVTSLLNSTTS